MFALGQFEGDATALAAAIPKADAAGVDAETLAAAKKALLKISSDKHGDLCIFSKRFLVQKVV